MSPLNDALADAVIAAHVHAALFGEVTQPPRLGRFCVLRALGSGAMGTVWLARDDALDRDVAVKLLRAGIGDDAEQGARLLTEARGLAKLSHPNVVVVHEVGSGELGVFIAMEYVDGGTLGQWLASTPRDVDAIVAMFAEAGRGLRAAHAAGVVHRDFKPDNVLVGTDGRPRVVDFGLARLGAVAGGDPASVVDGALGRLTRIGSLVGTPAYMAPEQLAGGDVDARSDQFAFALALFEAIAGRPAFAGTTIRERRSTFAAATLVWPPTMPRAVRRALGRALAVDPALRWPDMGALVDALAQRRRRWWIAPVGAAVVGTAVLVGRTLGGDDCDGAAALERGMWSAQRQRALGEAFAASDMPFAAPSLVTVRAGIDAAAQGMIDGAQAACVGERLRDDPSFAPASRACLRVMRDELGALLDELTDAPSASSIAAAPARAIGLPDAAACSDPRRAKLVGTLDDAAHARLEAARLALDRARRAHAELVFGGGAGFAARLEAALGDARIAAEQAEAEGARTLAAIARVLEARALLRRGDTTGAEAAASRAVEHATAIDDPILRAVAMTHLVYAVGAAGSRIDDARALAEQAAALIVAAGDPPLLRAQLENNLGLVISRDGAADKAESIEHHRRAIALFVDALGDAHPDSIAARVNLGSALGRIGRAQEALGELGPIVAPAIAVWGEDHPSTARLFGVIGNAWLRVGDLDVAERWLRRALASAQRSAPGDAEVANAQYNLATALRRRMPQPGDAPATAAGLQAATEAVALLRDALAIRERIEGTAVVNLIAYLVALGESELAAGDPVASEAALRRALQACEGAGAIPADFARVRLGLAHAVVGRDRAEARVLARSAREGFVQAERSGGVEACDRLLARLGAD